MTVRHVPYWLDRYPKSKRPAYARLRGPSQTAVVIVGGGLTGCACAWSFAAAGVRTVVLEADAIGAGATAGSVGLVREDFDESFVESASALGLRAARLMWAGMRRASLDFPAALRRLEARCDLGDADLLHVVPRDEPSIRRLRKEYQSRRDAGFEPTWMTPAAVSRARRSTAAAPFGRVERRWIRAGLGRARERRGCPRRGGVRQSAVRRLRHTRPASRPSPTAARSRRTP